ncbi:hypothetical protein ACW7G5_01360 [Luteimonas sp. A501]
MSARVRALFTWLLFGLLAAAAIGANPFRGETSTPVDLLASYPAWGSAVAKSAVRHPQRSDALDARLPQWTFAREELRQGRLPLWNDTSAGGDAALLKLTSGLLSPAFAAFALAPTAALGLYLSVLLNLTLAGVGMYFFLRRHVDRLPAAFGAVMFQFCGFIVAWLFWSHTLVIIWAPWLLLGVHVAIRSPRPSAVVGVALAMAMVLLGGFPFVSLLVCGAAGLYALVLATSLAAGERTAADFALRLARGLAPAAAGVCGGLLLAAIPLWVFVDWLGQFDISARASGSPLRLGREFALLFQGAAFSDRGVEAAMYVGTLGAVLALAGFAVVWLKRAEAFLLGLFALLLGAVALVLVFELVPRSGLDWIPGLSGNAWSRAIAILGLSFSMSAAAFLQKMTVLLRHRPLLREAPVGVVVFGLLCFQVVDQLRYFRLFNGPAQAAHYYPRTDALDYVLDRKGPFDYVIADNTYLVSGSLGGYGIREWFAHRFRSPALQEQLAGLVEDPFTTPTASIIRPPQIRLDADGMAAMNVRYLLVGAKSGLSRSLVGVRGSPAMQPLPDLPASQGWLQPFELLRPFAPESLKIRFATHQATDVDGSVNVVLRAESGDEVARMEVDAANVRDNEYLSLPVRDVAELPAGHYVIEVGYQPGPAARPITAWAAAVEEGGQLLAGGDATGLRLDFVLTSRRQPAHFRKVLESPHTQVWENTRSPNGPYFIERLDALPQPGSASVEVLGYQPGAFTLDYRGALPGYVVVPMEATRNWQMLVNGQPVEPALVRGLLPAVPVGAASRIEFQYRPAALGWLPAWIIALCAGAAGLGVWHRKQRGRKPLRNGGGSGNGGAGGAAAFPWLHSRRPAVAVVSASSVAQRWPATVGPLPRSVWIATAAWVCLMASWSLLLPTYRSADEAWHVGAVRYLQEQADWPGFKELRLQKDVVRSMRHAGLPHGPTKYPRLTTEAAVPRAERPSFSAIGEPVPSGANNQMTQHPPGYYALAAAATSVIPAAWRFDLFVLALRLFGVLLMAGLPLLAALVVRKLGGDRPAMAAAGLLPLCIPQLAATSGAVNNDSLLNIACAGVILGMVVVASGDARRRTACWLGVALAVALFAKAWALLLVPFVGLAYGAGAWRAGDDWKRFATPLLLVVLLSAFGGWWWLGNLLDYGTLQPAGHVPLLESGPLTFANDGSRWLRVLSERLPTRFWATLSIKPGTPYPPGLTRMASVLLLVAIALLFARRKSFGARRIDALLLAGPFLLGLVVLLESTWGLFSQTGITAGIQGRYLYFSIVGIASGVALAVAASIPVRFRDWLPMAMWIAFVAFAGTAQYKVLQAHWGPADASLGERWGAWTAWSAAPPWFMVMVLSGLVCSVLLLFAMLLRDALRQPAPVP